MLVGSFVLGCSETPYDFFPAGDDPAAVVDCSERDSFQNRACSDSDPQLIYWQDAGEIRDESPGPGCSSARNPGLEVVRIALADEDLCISRGDETMISASINYFIDLTSCSEDPAQMWTLSVDSNLAWEIRNDSVNMNLDVLYADTMSGTPLVLYFAHDLYNQRFFQTPLADGSFTLAPRHADDQCVTRVDDGLQIWPCEGRPEQRFRLLPCR